MLVGGEAARGQADAELPSAAEADLGPPVGAPDEALPEALRRLQPARVTREHVRQAGAPDLLGALADPENRERRWCVALDEPELQRLQARGDVGLVVARPARVHAPVPELGAERIARPCGRVAGGLDVVVRVDEDAVGAGPRHLAEDHRRSAGCLVELDSVEEALHPPEDPAHHLGQRGRVARGDRRDPAGLPPLLDQGVTVPGDRSLDGCKHRIRAQARTGTT